jgi:hypothetical protein
MCTFTTAGNAINQQWNKTTSFDAIHVKAIIILTSAALTFQTRRVL